VQSVKKLNLAPDEKMFSYDAEALFPSVPINDCIQIIKEKLDTDTSLNERTKLLPEDIVQLLHLCLSSSDFVFDGHHHTTNITGPIGPSLMVTVAQLWMIHTKERAIVVAQQRNINIPKHIEI
jgi:hypothetical protein